MIANALISSLAARLSGATTDVEIVTDGSYSLA
jgi:hypothetical protein